MSSILIQEERPKMSLLTNSISRRSAAKRLVTAGAAGMVVATQLDAAQIHMQNALRHLNNARNQLEMATPDKAGHRVKALELVNQAIAQVQEGIAAGV
jgi:hypothetical protein